VSIWKRPSLRAGGGRFVPANAANLPFAAQTFDLIVANHSLEHFDQLIPAIVEIGRVLKPLGFLIVTVPDASTLADKPYRWLHGNRPGGHVNAFRTPLQLPRSIAQYTGLDQPVTVILHSGFSILNRHNTRRTAKKLWLLGGGYEWMLRFATLAFRWSDRRWGTRLSVYGWAYYFGNCPPLSTVPSTNVCIRCGCGTPAGLLTIASNWFGIKAYACNNCGTRNFFTLDLDASTIIKL
jgi:hypothetical protein